MSDNDKRETVADIIAEMRLGNTGDLPFAYRIGRPDKIGEYVFGDGTKCKQRHIVIDEVTVEELTDRLEAAHERELEDAERRGNHAAMEAVAETIQKVGPLYDAESVGNVAAMREALVQCELFLGHVSRHGHPTLNLGDKCTACDGVEELRGMVVAALSAPPRNCDILTDFNDAITTLADERNWHDGKWDSERYCILASWLLAPATAEKEGGL